MTRLLAGLALVVVVAAVLRARGLQLVPAVTDESEEVRYAWDIAFEGERPLTHTDAYNGPLWPYLMAAGLRIVGPSVYLPRVFTFAFGLGAVLATFALAALLAEPDRRAGAATIAGLLVATSFTSALVSSRVAWSNSTTPFWTTLAALLLVLAVRRPESVAWWLAAGLAAGLALNTHPSVAAYLAGLAVWLLLAQPRRLHIRRPGPWLALAACIAAYLPVILYNVAGPADTLAQAAESRNVETEMGPASYAANLTGLVGQLGRSIAGGFDAAEQPVWTGGVLLIALLALALTVAAARARSPDTPGRRLPLVVSLATVLMLPAVNQNWSGFLEARYLALLAPLMGVAAGVAVTSGRSRSVRRAAAVGCALLIAVSAVRTWGHVDAALALNNPNGAMLELVRVAGLRSSLTGEQAHILVADELEDVAWPHRGDPARAITYYLMLAGVPFESERLVTIRHLVAEGSAGAVIMPGPAAGAMGLEPRAVVRQEGYEEWGLYTGTASGASVQPSSSPGPSVRKGGTPTLLATENPCRDAMSEPEARGAALMSLLPYAEFTDRTVERAELMTRTAFDRARPPSSVWGGRLSLEGSEPVCVWVVQMRGGGRVVGPLQPPTPKGSAPDSGAPHPERTFSMVTAALDAETGRLWDFDGWVRYPVVVPGSE